MCIYIMHLFVYQSVLVCQFSPSIRFNSLGWIRRALEVSELTYFCKDPEMLKPWCVGKKKIKKMQMIGENDSVKTLLFLNTRKSANHSRHSETLQRHRDVRHFNSWKAFSQNCYLIRHKKTYCRQKCIDDSSQAALTTLLTEASVQALADIGDEHIPWLQNFLQVFSLIYLVILTGCWQVDNIDRELSLT